MRYCLFRDSAGRTASGLRPVASTARALPSIRRRLPTQHRRPRGLLGRGRAHARLARGTAARARRRRASAGALVPGRRAQHVPQRGRPPRRRRPRRSAGADLRQPGDGDEAHLHLRASCATRSPGWPAPCGRLASSAATASSSTCRWCPRPSSRCSPARGSARSTRSCSAASRRTSSPSRIDDAQPRVILSASCGIEGARTIAYKPLLDAALDEAAHAPARCVILQRPELRGRADRRPRPRLARARGRAPSPCRACRCARPTRSTSSTRPARPAARRASCATTAATRSRSRWSMPNVYDVQPGEVFWAASDVGWVVGHSYIVYAPLLVGATTVLYEGKPVGTPDRGRVLARDRGARVAALFTAPTAHPRHPQGGPGAALLAAPRRCRRCARCSWPASAPIPTPTLGRPRARSPGRRPLVADGDRLGHRGELPRPRSASRQGRLAQPARCRATASTSSTPTAAQVAERHGRAPSPSACRCRPARSRRSGTTTTAASRRTSSATRAGT